MATLQGHLDAITTAIANLSPKVDPSAVKALEEISSFLAEVKIILTETDVSAIYIK